MLLSEVALKFAENLSEVTDTLLEELLETVLSVRYVLRPRTRLVVQTLRSSVIQSRSVATIR